VSIGGLIGAWLSGSSLACRNPGAIVRAIQTVEQCLPPACCGTAEAKPERKARSTHAAGRRGSVATRRHDPRRNLVEQRHLASRAAGRRTRSWTARRARHGGGTGLCGVERGSGRYARLTHEVRRATS
jgi:hypothetical protein